MEEIIGYAALALTGLSLGLVGGGGSVLTVPVLVYLFHIEPSVATAYSLLIVGVTSFAGTVRNALEGNIDYRLALLFAVPGFFTVMFTRRFILPAIPDVLQAGSFSVNSEVALMLFFGLVMLLAALRMLSARGSQNDRGKELALTPILISALITGLVTGLAGAGGGFLIIPAMVLFAGTEMKKAVGTSLLVITLNSLIGVANDQNTSHVGNYPFIAALSGIAIVGFLGGTYLSSFFSGEKLKQAFGWFVLLLGLFILYKEGWGLMA